MLAGYVVKTVSLGSLGLYMLWSNKRRDRQAKENGEVLSVAERNSKAAELGMGDVTEWANPYFRYAL